MKNKMNLPSSDTLPIYNLSSIFNKTTNSYKFIWLLAILDSLRNGGKEKIPLKNLIYSMISIVWFPINYYNLSFGKQDQFYKIIKGIKFKFRIRDDINKSELTHFLNLNDGDITIDGLKNNLARYVPFRFLSPWYTNELRGKSDSQKNRIIYNYSSRYFNSRLNKPIYKFSQDRRTIILHSDWVSYLIKHLKILTEFTLWNLGNYLQGNNPNVPNLQRKLFPPLVRKLSNAKLYWKSFIENAKNEKCVFSKQIINLNNISIDHFIPWRFVAHDQLWNLIPVLKRVNSYKGDNIPSEIYLNDFANLQHRAFLNAVNSNLIKPKILEDYTILFNDTLNNIGSISNKKFSDRIIKNLKPMMQIAINMGFRGNWKFKND